MYKNWMDVEVIDKQLIAEDVVSLKLMAKGQIDLPIFDAGAHVDVEIPGGFVRQYSLCNNPAQREYYEIAVLKVNDSRGGSKSVHQDIVKGQTIRISEPRNHFPLVEAKHSILMAAGIGVTPILSMAHTLNSRADTFEFNYCVRSQSRAAFIEQIKSSGFAGNLRLFVGSGAAVLKMDAAIALGEADPDKHLYVCGPAGFIDYIFAVAIGSGWSQENIHCERFKPAAVELGGDNEFEVQLLSTGQVIKVPADESVLECLLAQDIDVPFSCEQGICGCCALNIIGGKPDHRDMYFSAEQHAANDQFTPCCSRSKTQRLIIDL